MTGSTVIAATMLGEGAAFPAPAIIVRTRSLATADDSDRPILLDDRWCDELRLSSSVRTSTESAFAPGPNP